MLSSPSMLGLDSYLFPHSVYSQSISYLFMLHICRSSSIADESPVFALMNSSMKSFTFTTSHSVSQARDRAMIGHGRSSIGDTERQRNLRKTHLSKDFRQKYVTLSLA